MPEGTATAQWDAQLASLTELSDEELLSLEADLVTAFDAADSAGDVPGSTEIADALDTVRAESDTRSSVPDPVEPEVAAPEPVMADAAPDEVEPPPDPVPVPPPAPVAVPAVPVAVPVAAVPDVPAAVPAPAAAAADPAPEDEERPAVAATAVQVPSGHEPVVAATPPSVVVAGADLPGISVGTPFKDGMDFGRAMAARINTIGRVMGGDGEQLLVASIQSPAPKERVLNYNDPEGNKSKIEGVTHLDAIVAAGGLCAPLTTKYDLFDCGGVADRPVRDALAGFQADRGGIRFFPGPNLAALSGAVGFWTSTDDANAVEGVGAAGPYKVCARIACPAEVTAEIQAVTLCLTFGVMQTRVFPELAVANNKLAMVAHSRLADSSLLAQIKAGSRAITETAKLSVPRDIFDSIGRAVILYRDRYRLNKDIPLHAIFPTWLLEVFRGDIAMGDPGGGSPRATLSVSDAEIEGFFRDRKINVTWALDSSAPGTNGGGFFAAETGTTLLAWPTTLQWALYPEGSWLFLDGGSLDLGVVRDSTLIKVNDYMQFSETFEAATRIGCESYWVTSTLALTGQYMGPRTDPAFLSATAANA
jgi:hypothetical protein